MPRTPEQGAAIGAEVATATDEIEDDPELLEDSGARLTQEYENAEAAAADEIRNGTRESIRQSIPAFTAAKASIEAVHRQMQENPERFNHGENLEVERVQGMIDRSNAIGTQMVTVTGREGEGTPPEELNQLATDIDLFINDATSFTGTNFWQATSSENPWRGDGAGLAPLERTARFAPGENPNERPPLAPLQPGQPQPPQPPRRPDGSLNISDAQRREALKLSDNILQAMRDEERNRLIQRGLDRGGFFRSLFFPGKIVREVDAAGAYNVTPEIRAMVQEYAVQRVTGQNVTESSDQVFRLMQSYGFEINPQNGTFVPQHADSNWLSRMVHFDRSKTTGLTFVGGMALGHATRLGLATMLDGAARAVGAGALVGGMMGWLRGRREGAEATTSGDSWTTELDAALATGQEAQIELACHKVERIFNDENARREFFRGRTRMEASRVLQRYQEGVRRLSLIEMSRSAARRNEQQFASEQERNEYIAEQYANFCRQMSQGEGRFMAAYGGEYSQALLREVGIVAVDAGGRPVAGAADGATVPGAPGIDAADLGARQQVETGFARDTARRRRERRRIVVSNAIRGAVVGAVAGGVGWYVGQWLSGLIGGGEHAGAATGGTGHEGGAAGGIAPGGENAAPGTTGGETHWGYFTNENTMPEQAFSPDRVHQLGMDSLLNDPRCPTTFIDGHPFVGTDQGAALREAVIHWQNNLNFHGMNQEHVTNLMNFAGSHDSALPVDVGAGYHLSQEQAQAVIDHVWNGGSPVDANIFDANQIMADTALGQAAETAGAAGAAVPGLAGAAATTAEEAGRGIWPGWMLVAGAAGLGAGYGIDSIRRNNQIAGTNQSIAGAGARTVGTETGGPFGGIDTYGAPQPQPPIAPQIEPQPQPTPPPEPPPAPPEPNRERIEQLNRDRGELQARIEQIQNRINELSNSLALAELGIDGNDQVYNSLEEAAEGEPRQNLLANRISERRRERLFTLPAIEEANQGDEEPIRNERLRQYAEWDWYRAEERIGPFNERLEQQQQLETATNRLAEIDAELERLNQNG